MFPYEAEEPFVAILTFAYGLSYFSLAVGVWLHRRNLGEHPVTRHLPLLGFYSLFHGFSEWGEVFIPIQARVLPHPTIHVLQALHVLTLGLSFLFLLEFGARFVAAAKGRWWRSVSLGGAAVFLWVLVQAVITLQSESETVHFWAMAELEAWIRHLLAIPAALLAATGIYLHRRGGSRDKALGDIHSTLVLMAWVLGGFALVGGWIVPQCPILPGSHLNASVIYEQLGIQVQVIRAVLGLTLTGSIFYLLKELDVQRQLRMQRAEEHAAVLTERERIARDLHDGVIQSLYGVCLQLEGMLPSLERERPPAAGQVRRAVRTIQETMQDIRNFVLHLRRIDPRQADLRAALQNLVEEFQTSSLVEPLLLLPPGDLERGLPQGAVTQIHFMVRELLTNVARHSRAHHVQVEVRRHPASLELRVQDDGIGLKPQVVMADGTRQGLGNIASRVQWLGGTLSIADVQPSGTRVLIEIPLVRSGTEAGEGG